MDERRKQPVGHGEGFPLRVGKRCRLYSAFCQDTSDNSYNFTDNFDLRLGRRTSRQMVGIDTGNAFWAFSDGSSARALRYNGYRRRFRNGSFSVFFHKIYGSAFTPAYIYRRARFRRRSTDEIFSSLAYPVFHYSNTFPFCIRRGSRLENNGSWHKA